MTAQTWQQRAPLPARVLLALALFVLAGSYPLGYELLTPAGRAVAVIAFVIGAVALSRYRGVDALKVRLSGSTVLVLIAAAITAIEYWPALWKAVPDSLFGLLFFAVLPLSFFSAAAYALVQTIRFQAVQFAVEASLCVWFAILFFAHEFP